MPVVWRRLAICLNGLVGLLGEGAGWRVGHNFSFTQFWSDLFFSRGAEGSS